MMRTQIVTCLCVLCLTAGAQGNRPWEQYLNEVMTQEDVGTAQWEQTYELLCELEQHPMDINRATREQLEELPFLSAQQIEGIVEYLDRYGPMKSAGELRMVRQLDDAQRRLLTCFIVIGDEPAEGFPSVKTVARYGRTELMATGRVPFYERKGDREGYLGHPYRHWLRGQFSYGDYIKLGLVGAQDAGEPFFAHQNRMGYDYYSAYLQLHRLGRIETLVAGKYRVSLGMGLTINNSFALGKVSMLETLGRTTHSLRAHSSRSADYLQGVGATVRILPRVRATAFLSYRPMDATLNKDSTVSTILETDYHRTEAEMRKKHNLHALTTGGSLRYGGGGFRLGLNTVYTRLDRMLAPNTSTLYRRHYPQGRDFLNVGIDYGYVGHRIALNGETAIDKAGHPATINSLSLQLADGLSLMALQRFYAYHYAALHAQSYSDGGRVQNESGVYLGLTWQPSPRLRLTAYTDYAYFAWARYQVSQSSHSWDNLVQCSYIMGGWTLSGRYRLRLRQQDNSDKTSLTDRLEHRARLSADFSSAQGWGSRTQLDGDIVQGGQGAMISQALSYTRERFRLNGGIGYFHTDNYDSRVYLYERGPLYSYGIQQFYGMGLRYWLMVRADIRQRLTLTAKLGTTNYFDRSVIGSGYQQIGHSAQTDLDVQLRWKF